MSIEPLKQLVTFVITVGDFCQGDLYHQKACQKSPYLIYRPNKFVRLPLSSLSIIVGKY